MTVIIAIFLVGNHQVCGDVGKGFRICTKDQSWRRRDDLSKIDLPPNRACMFDSAPRPNRMLIKPAESPNAIFNSKIVCALCDASHGLATWPSPCRGTRASQADKLQIRYPKFRPGH